MSETSQSAVISAPISIDPRWERVPGVRVYEDRVDIHSDTYFFRYDKPSWVLVDWQLVCMAWDQLNESPLRSLEQVCLDFILLHGRNTTNTSEVLQTAEQVYAFLYDESHLCDPDLAFANELHLRILREMSTLMALNNVALDGALRNLGSSWFFTPLSKLVFDLTDSDAQRLHELYHGGFFGGSRRVDAIKAHIALGGRLIHG